MSIFSSSLTAPTRPDSARYALGLLLSFGISLSFAWFWGRELVEAVLPLIRELILWLDDRFAILALGIDRIHQDTVVRLRVDATAIIVIGGQLAMPRPGEWIEVTTTVGAMLQPLVIAVGLAGAWPGRNATRIIRVTLALVLGIVFLLIDLPITLHAYVWDMYRDSYDPELFSPLLIWHEFMHAGGRLGIGVLMGIFAAIFGSWIEQRAALPVHPAPQT